MKAIQPTTNMKPCLYLICLLYLQVSFAQQGSPLVSGKVFNEEGQPLPGTLITWPGSRVQTFADENGAFELVSTNEIDEILVTCAGYDTVIIYKDLSLPLEIILQKKVIHDDSPYWFIADSSDIKHHKLDSLLQSGSWKVTREGARYPGGFLETERFMRQIMHYPKRGLEEKIEGIVEVEFTVNKEGRAENPKIIKSLGEDFDQEVIQFILAMPRWYPARMAGKYPVAVQIQMPVEFKLKAF